VAKLKGHSFNVRCAAFSEEGQRIVTSSGDSTARVWDAANGRLLADLQYYAQGVRSRATPVARS